MKIAFLHYHLKPGGVTTVILQQLLALQNDCETIVLTGEPPKSALDTDTVYVPGVGYDQKDTPFSDPGKTANAILNAIYSKWPAGCDILHVHNPVLAKNKNFLKILKILQQKGVTLFLQVHDFAEDGRPLTYYSIDEYLCDCHYGVINSRDYGILLKAGLKKAGLHKTFNMVNGFNTDLPEMSAKNTVLYPVRAIRRKNIGEAILVSLYFKHNETLAITRPPNSDADKKSHGGWKRFVKENGLNIEFDASSKADFRTLVLSSKFFITTSITEGFGFSYLEPWTAKKFLCGRKLPDICSDFEKNNIVLEHLYDRLLIPVKWIGKKNLLSKFESSARNNCKRFGFPITDEDVEQFLSQIVDQQTIDFGLLDEAFQKLVIIRLLADKKNKDQLTDLNRHLVNIDSVPDKDTLIENNSKQIESGYSLRAYRNNLLAIYKKIVNNPVSHSIDKKALFLEFITPNNFSLLKWSPYVE